MSEGAKADLRRAMAELIGPTRQIGRFGSPAEIAAAVDALHQTTAALYWLLADGPGEDRAPTDA